MNVTERDLLEATPLTAKVWVLIGLLTRPAAFALAIAMLVAIISVHRPNGLFRSNNGYEFGLALLAISVALVFNGGGKLSLDHKLSK